MKTLLKSNDHVLISWTKHILSLHKINFFVMDESMSNQEGSIAAIPIRILIQNKDHCRALYIINLEKPKF